MAPASATPTAGASGYKTASKAVVTGTEPAAPAASTQKDDDYVYIRVPWEKVAPVDTGRTETVRHHVSQSAGPQNAVPVLQSVPVKLPAPASQQWLGDSSTISYARVCLVAWRVWRHEHGYGGHRTAFGGADAACRGASCGSRSAEVKVITASGSGITAMSEELVEALRRQPGMMQTALTQALVGHARVVTSLGQDCNIVT